MAGAVVYVFAYDTWGKVVNNFAYKTQIKSDGSFQAAGLPNASHYGIYYPDEANYLSKYFRNPTNDDGLQSAFAYQQAIFPTDDAATPNTQISGEKVPDKIKGSNIFITSSRSVDISNHINIFPLVPITVLSVIIKDPTSVDFDNFNKPYEIYAQRVISTPYNSDSSSNSINYESCSINYDPATCKGITSNSSSPLTNGPVVRGRSIYYTPRTSAGAPCGAATIFQAFAPSGTYAITYWRPDGKDAQKQVTYLNFDGSQPLNTPYNGIAIESVNSAASTSRSWGELSKRCVSDNALSGNPEYWSATSYSANLWGLLYQGVQGRQKTLPADAQIRATISDSQLFFVDPITKTCKKPASGNSGSNSDRLNISLYMFSSCNFGDISNTGSRTADLTISSEGGSFANVKTETYRNLKANSEIGPSRMDFGVNTTPSNGAAGTLLYGGKPLAYQWLDLEAGGRTYKRFTQTDAEGNFFVGSGFLLSNPKATHVVRLNNPHQEDLKKKTFTFNASNMPNYANQLYALGDINMGDTPGTVQSFLAYASLDRFFSLFKITPAYAQSQYASPNDWEYNGNFSNGQWAFYIDPVVSSGYERYFTRQNYKLETVELNPPDEYIDYIINNSVACAGRDADDCSIAEHLAERNLFDRNNSDETPDGIISESGNETDKIIGVSLKRNSDYDNSEIVDDIFEITGKESLVFYLRLKFNYEGNFYDGLETPANEATTSTGQELGNAPPKTLETRWPVHISKDTNTDGQYEVSYEPVVLKPVQDCGNIGIKDILHPTEVIKSMSCTVVVGGLQMVESFFNKIAGSFFTIQPLDFDIVTDFWNIIRNTVNAMAVLILLIAGVAIMFRYEPSTYKIQSILTKLVITIILINFSILIVQVAVDIANVIAFGGYRFLIDAISSNGDMSVTGEGASAAAAGIAAIGTYALMLAMSSGGVPIIIALLLFLFAVVGLFGYVAIRIIIDYGIRLAILWLCIIFAPLAFAARVLPATQSYFGKWRNILVGTLVAQIAFALVLAIAIGILKQSVALTSFNDAFITFALALVMFFFATKIPSKAAAMVGTDVSVGLEGLAKKGLATTGSKIALARDGIIQRRARDVKRAADLGVADADRVTRNRALGKDSRAQFRNKYLQRNILFGRTQDDVNKLYEEGEKEALEMLQAKERRDNKEAFDHSDELEYAKKSSEIKADAIIKQQEFSVPEVGAWKIQEDVKNKIVQSQAEIESEQLRLARPEVADWKREDEARNKKFQTETELETDDLKRQSGVLQERIQVEKKLDAIEDTRGEILEQQVRTSDPYALGYDRGFKTEKRETEAEAQLSNLRNRIANPNISEHELNEITRQAEATANRARVEANMRIAHPESLDNRDKQALKEQEYKLSDESVGQIFEGVKFTDARTRFVAAVASAYTIDNNFQDPTTGAVHKLGDMTVSPDNAYLKGLNKVFNDAQRTAPDTARFINARTAAYRQIRDKGLQTNKQEANFINRFTYNGITDANQAWRAWLEDTGAYSGSTIKAMEDSDVKGAVLTIVKSRAVSKSGVNGWANQLNENEKQATGARVPDRAIMSMRDMADLQITQPLPDAIRTNAKRRHVAATPRAIYGEYYENARKWISIVNDAYSLNRDLDATTSPSLAQYNTAIEGLGNLGFTIQRGTP